MRIEGEDEGEFGEEVAPEDRSDAPGALDSAGTQPFPEQSMPAEGNNAKVDAVPFLILCGIVGTLAVVLVRRYRRTAARVRGRR